MDEKHLQSIPGFNAEDWEQTPVSIKKLVVELVLKLEQLEQRLKALEIENQQLREKNNRNSSNSNTPPSSDISHRHGPKKKKPTGKKRIG